MARRRTKTKMAGSDDPILAALQAAHGPELVRMLGGSSLEDIQGLSWGLPSLNWACTGNPFVGLPFGRMIELYGVPSSGKTTLLLQAIARAQSQGVSCGFVDAEQALDVRYGMQLGVDKDALYFSQPDNGEEGLSVAESMVDAGVKLIAVDSVAALTPQVLLNGTYDKQRMGAAANMMKLGIDKLKGKVRKKGAIVVFINQLKNKIGVVFGSSESTPGGDSVKFYSSLRIRTALSIAAGKSVKGATMVLGSGKNERLGTLGTISVTKNKVSPPFREINATLYYGRGYDQLLDTYLFAEAFGLIESARGGYKVNGKAVALKDLAQSVSEVEDLLRANISIFQQDSRLLLSGDGEVEIDEEAQELQELSEKIPATRKAKKKTKK